MSKNLLGFTPGEVIEHNVTSIALNCLLHPGDGVPERQTAPDCRICFHVQESGEPGVGGATEAVKETLMESRPGMKSGGVEEWKEWRPGRNRGG